MYLASTPPSSRPGYSVDEQGVCGTEAGQEAPGGAEGAAQGGDEVLVATTRARVGCEVSRQ